MTDNNVISLNKPEVQEILQEGARKLLANAVEAEIKRFLAEQKESNGCT